MLFIVSEYAAQRHTTQESRRMNVLILTPLPFLISQLVLAADEATTRWTLRTDLAVIEPPN
jgi:hypothetical protein